VRTKRPGRGNLECSQGFLAGAPRPPSREKELSRTSLLRASSVASWHFSGEIYDMPILVFHGTEDETVPMTTSEELKRRVPHVQLVRCAGAGHIECWNLDPKAYESQVRKFLERAP
jgi:pimeloyl-ACP methyl ester carboxylesterase